MCNISAQHWFMKFTIHVKPMQTKNEIDFNIPYKLDSLETG